MNPVTGPLSEKLLTPERSQFLTILCILTFIGSSFGLLRAIPIFTSSELISKETAKIDPKAEHRENLKKRKDKESEFEIKMLESVKMYSDKKKVLQRGISEIIANLLTLTGAILMWRMNPKGYFFYVAGILLWVFGPLLIFGTGSFLAVMESAVGFFAGLLFCILYAMNLKDMKAEKVT